MPPRPQNADEVAAMLRAFIETPPDVTMEDFGALYGYSHGAFRRIVRGERAVGGYQSLSLGEKERLAERLRDGLAYHREHPKVPNPIRPAEEMAEILREYSSSAPEYSVAAFARSRDLIPATFHKYITGENPGARRLLTEDEKSRVDQRRQQGIDYHNSSRGQGTSNRRNRAVVPAQGDAMGAGASEMSNFTYAQWVAATSQARGISGAQMSSQFGEIPNLENALKNLGPNRGDVESLAQTRLGLTRMQDVWYGREGAPAFPPRSATRGPEATASRPSLAMTNSMADVARLTTVVRPSPATKSTSGQSPSTSVSSRSASPPPAPSQRTR